MIKILEFYSSNLTILCGTSTEAGDVLRSHEQPRRAVIGRRRRRKRDVIGRQDGDDSLLPLATVDSIGDVTALSRDQLSRDQSNSLTLNPRTPLPAINNHQSGTCSLPLRLSVCLSVSVSLSLSLCLLYSALMGK